MLFSGTFGTSSEFSSILSITDVVGVNSLLDKMVKVRLQIMNKVATTAVAFVKKLPADLENIKLSCDTPIPSAPPSDFWNKTKITKITASIIFIINIIFSTNSN